MQELGSQPLPTIVTEDAENSNQASHDQGHRPRAGALVIHILSFDEKRSIKPFYSLQFYQYVDFYVQFFRSSSCIFMSACY